MHNYKGEGSQQRSAVVTGRFPSRLTVDVGNQDVVISRQRGNRVSLRHFKDIRGSASDVTIKKGHIASKKRGRIYRTSVAGGSILSRRALRGY